MSTDPDIDDDLAGKPDERAATRRIDAGLCELLGGERAPDVTLRVLARHRGGETVTQAPSAPGPRWLLAAAALVLGAATVFGTALLTKHRSGDGMIDELQSPAANAPLREATSRAEIATLPTDLRAVELRNLDDDAVRELAQRCPDLEHLRVFASTAWRRADDQPAVSITDGALATIATLGRLRQLELIGTLEVTGSALHELEKLPLLADLTFRFLDVEDRHLARLDRMPSLRSLALETMTGVGPEALAAIGRLAGLRRLSLHGCPGLPPSAFAPLAKLTTLESLGLTGINRFFRGAATPEVARRYPLKWEQAPQGDLVVDSLHPWPRLVELDLGFNPGLTADVGHVLTQRTPGVTALTLTGCEGIDDATIADVARLPKLTRLTLGDCAGVTQAALATLTDAPTLREVDFGETAWLTLDHAKQLLEAGKLVRAKRRKDPAFERDLAALAQQYTERTVRSLDDVRGLTRLVTHVQLRLLGDAAARLLRDHRQLVSVRFVGDGGDRLTAAGVSDILTLPALQTLEVLAVPDLPADALRGVGRCRSLRELRLHDAPVANEVLAELANLPSLTALAIASSSGMTADGVRAIARCAHLQRLELCALPDLTGEAIAELRRLDNLRTLHVRKLPGLDDRALTALCEIRSLRELDLTSAPVSERGLASLAELRNLELLRLADVPAATDATLLQLPTGLRQLDLTRCEALDGNAGAILRDRFPKLEQLDLVLCPWLDAAALTAVLGAPSLRELSVVGCHAVQSGPTLVTAIAAAKSLRLLDASNSSALSQDQLAQLRALRPELTVRRKVW